VACEAFPYLRQGSLMLAEVFCVDGRAGLFGFGGKGTGLLHDFTYVGIAFLLTGPLGRHRWVFGRRLGVGLRPEAKSRVPQRQKRVTVDRIEYIRRGGFVRGDRPVAMLETRTCFL
jgi:hypothetical protein